MPGTSPQALCPQRCPPGCWSPRPPPPSGPVGTAWGLRRSSRSTCRAETTDACIPPREPHPGGRAEPPGAPALTGPASWWWPSPASPGSAAAGCRRRRGCPSPAPAPGRCRCPGAGRPAGTAGRGRGLSPGAHPEPHTQHPSRGTLGCCRWRQRGRVPRGMRRGGRRGGRGSALSPQCPPAHLLVQPQGVDLGEHPAHAAVAAAHQDAEGGELLEEAQPAWGQEEGAGGVPPGSCRCHPRAGAYPRCGPPFMRSKTWAGLRNCLNLRRNLTPWLSPLLELTKARRGLEQVEGQVAFQKPAGSTRA